MKFFALLSTFLAGVAVVAACGGSDAGTGTASGSSSGGSSSGGSSSGGSSGTSSSGGSSGTATGPTDSGTADQEAGSAAQEAAYCQAVASHETCNGGTASGMCEEDGKCLYGRLMSKTAADAYNACYSAPSCKSDDACVVEAGKAAGGAAADTYAADCVAKAGACPGTIDEDLCSPAVFAYPTVSGPAQACLAKPCNEVEDCFKAAIEPIGDCK